MKQGPRLPSRPNRADSSPLTCYSSKSARSCRTAAQRGRLSGRAPDCRARRTDSPAVTEETSLYIERFTTCYSEERTFIHVRARVRVRVMHAHHVISKSSLERLLE